jgi:hypothetical protein
MVQYYVSYCSDSCITGSVSIVEGYRNYERGLGKSQPWSASVYLNNGRRKYKKSNLISGNVFCAFLAPTSSNSAFSRYPALTIPISISNSRTATWSYSPLIPILDDNVKYHVIQNALFLSSRKMLRYVGSEVLAAVVMKSSIFENMRSWSPLKVNGRFGGTCRLHFLGRRISQARIHGEADGSSSETPVDFKRITEVIALQWTKNIQCSNWIEDTEVRFNLPFIYPYILICEKADLSVVCQLNTGGLKFRNRFYKYMRLEYFDISWFL